MIIYINGEVDRDELTYDEAIQLSTAEIISARLWWFAYAVRHDQPIRKAA